MKDVADKTAFVTGGASGIGFGMARAFLQAGMKVVIADIRQDHLDEAAATLKGVNTVHFIRLDVTDRAAMAAAADEAERVFGKVHVLCNNAGVGIMGGVKDATFDDWDWGMSVNLDGVFNGVRTFLPRIIAHGEGGHIVNTSSISAVLPGGVVYAAAKSAVMGLSEAMAEELAAEGVGVTCLMPGPITTNIHEVAKLRPQTFSDTNLGEAEQALLERVPSADWMDPLEVGAMVLDAIRRDLLFVFTHNEFKAGVEQRFQAVLGAFPRGPVDEARAKRLGFPVARPIYARILDADEPPAGSGEGD
jgi:NAD(P)-dependent dehydrogenase (short-subunit alcohol dehydrogenase family)